MQRLDPALHVLFSEFRETVYARVALEEDLRASRGAPVRKTVKGRTYWYLQTVKEGRRVQRYLGPDTPEVRALVEDLRKASAEKRALVASLRRREAELARTLRAAGLPTLPGPIFRVVEALSAARVIWKRGLLVGTMAFGAYAGMLGWRWDRPSVRASEVEVLCGSDEATSLPPRVRPLSIPWLADLLVQNPADTVLIGERRGGPSRYRTPHASPSTSW